MGFRKDPTIIFESDLENAANPLGSTAYYSPSDYSVTIYVDSRHPKDIMRSLNHELVHHKQNCQGKFEEEIYISQTSKIYPNPVLDQINVMVGGTNNKVKLLLFNINGVLLEEKEILFDKYQRDFIFNMDNYPRGMYLISVQSEGKIENFKFLKL